jgi:hypothetical protein
MVCPESIEGDAVTLDRLQPVRQLSINSARSLYREAEIRKMPTLERFVW